MIPAYAALFLRGFLIVALTAANVRQIAAQRYGSAFLVGVGISLVWWFNSNTAAHSTLTGAAIVYAIGAGFGTVVGMYLTRGSRG